MSLLAELAKKVLVDEYFRELLLKAEKKAALNFFKKDSNAFNKKELTDLLRFADILSRSDDFTAKNKAYKIVSLLSEEYLEDAVFRVFSKSILVKLGNFPAINYLDSHLDKNDIKDIFPAEVLMEKSFKEVYHEIPDTDFTFTDNQYEIFEQLKNNNHFSFSGPTSLGKSFILKAFVRFLIHAHNSTDNIIILVPTRALINQTVNEFKGAFKAFQNYRILAHPIVPTLYRSEQARYIFVFTPERLLAYLSETENPKIDYLFVDEAHKIISENDTRSPILLFDTAGRAKKCKAIFLIA